MRMSGVVWTRRPRWNVAPKRRATAIPETHTFVLPRTGDSWPRIIAVSPPWTGETRRKGRLTYPDSRMGCSAAKQTRNGDTDAAPCRRRTRLRIIVLIGDSADRLRLLLTTIRDGETARGTAAFPGAPAPAAPQSRAPRAARGCACRLRP